MRRDLHKRIDEDDIETTKATPNDEEPEGYKPTSLSTKILYVATAVLLGVLGGTQLAKKQSEDLVKTAANVAENAGYKTGLAAARTENQRTLDAAVKEATQTGYQQAHQELIDELDDFRFNTRVVREAGLTYQDEANALSHITVVEKPEPKGESDEKIEALFNNSVAVGNVSVPIFSAPDFFYEVWDKTGRDPELDPHPSYYLPNWANGFLISPSGHIVTNLHVVEDETFSDYRNLIVMDGEKNPIPVTGVLAHSPESDIALIKVDRQFPNFVPVTLRLEDTLETSMTVHNIGTRIVDNTYFDFGTNGMTLRDPDTVRLRTYISTGTLTGIEYTFDITSSGIVLVNAIETTAFTKGGQSGSFTIDIHGNVVGLHSLGSKTSAWEVPASAILGLRDFYLDELRQRDAQAQQAQQ
tara:strand:- start:2911 stop:4149 length:1239 start_codon:yes stop_codon:yes gene_type:complete